MESPLALFSHELAGLVAKVSPSVVAVDGRRRTHSSGVHWRDGLVITAEHTLRRDEEIFVSMPGATIPAALVGRDPGSDIALLKVEGLSVPPIDLSVTAESHVGDVVLVVGRSPNSGPNASMGIISAISGPWRTWRGGELDQYVRLDASVFPGSSGGAVIDFRGQFLGIATSALSRVAGLALPVSNIRSVVDVLVEKGSIPRGYIGVALQPVPVPDSFRDKLSIKNGNGIMVLSVADGGPADKGGILIGDIMFEIEGKTVESPEELQSMLGWKNVGKSVLTKVIRGGVIKELVLAVEERKRR